MGQVHDCYWSWDNQTLTVGNALIERSWTVTYGYWIGKSLLDKSGCTCAWIDDQGETPVFALPACRVVSKVSCRAETENDCGIGNEHLAVYAEYQGGGAAVRFVVRIYPDEAFVRHTVELKKSGEKNGENGQVDESGEESIERNGFGMKLDDNNTESYGTPEQYIDYLPLQELHVKWACVAFLDRTDSNNNLVQKTEGLLYPNEKRGLRGNVMLLRKTLFPHGLVVIKESPTAYGHLEDPGEDFRWLGRQLFVTGGGIRADGIPGDDYITAYGTAVGVCDGSPEGELRLLHRYHRSIRRYEPDRDFMIMSNTWGDRNKDGRVREDFILKEIRAAGRLGITHVQIDDGWQAGATKNSVVAGGRWGSYHEDGMAFWDVHRERFPRGLAPLVDAARAEGVRLGLWFSPDSSEDFAHWEQDAAVLLGLYRKYGIRCFKLDGIHIRSKAGERNLLRLMRTVLKQSGGAVIFNQDTTAEVRLGYFGQTQYGGIFLENRYTDWGNYYPHWTLRNLWQLAKYVPAQKLQIEFLNVERNKQLYDGDPLAPAACGLLYAWACTMFANPLAWMELTELSEEAQQLLGAAIACYRKHQADILSGTVLPVGAEPDGTSWTGLQSVTGEREGYVLILREKSAAAAADIRLWRVPQHGGASIRLETIMAMDGHPHLDIPETARVWHAGASSGTVRFAFANPFSFGLYCYHVQKTQ